MRTRDLAVITPAQPLWITFYNVRKTENQTCFRVLISAAAQLKKKNNKKNIVGAVIWTALYGGATPPNRKSRKTATNLHVCSPPEYSSFMYQVGAAAQQTEII